ncbi:hypothetical protein [Methylobacterium organophilum]|uniref:Uncharacterized protein n=1 Tax=Methylobacterium organophilum TaxID=410 RepID=A0ABQ4TGQ8_METOR|nr:hypothetical protein [Methylobacterium organophilum]GJE29552.1 hypothetical protein LKMONMHP_4434 [Methylobacterium organophilum]
MADVIPFTPRRPAPPAPTPLQSRTLRDRIEEAAQSALDTADHLIAILDDMDGEADLEGGGDEEPSLGAPEGCPSQVVYFRGGDRDLEHDTQQEHTR